MTDRDQLAMDPEPAELSARLEEAIHNLSLGIVIFDSKRQVIFCNRRYMQMYGLTAEQVKPGTPTSDLIRHRLKLGLKVRWRPRTISASASAATSRSTPPSRNSPTAGSSPTPSARCPMAAESPPMKTSPSARNSMPASSGSTNSARSRKRPCGPATSSSTPRSTTCRKGLCFFDADHKLIVCNDRFLEMYDIPPGRVGPGTPLTEIVDLRLKPAVFRRCRATNICAGAAMSRFPRSQGQHRRTEERAYLQDPPPADARPAAGSPPMKTSPSSARPRSRSSTWRTTTR